MKIIGALIGVIALLIVAFFVLNQLVPNAMIGVNNVVEDMIYDGIGVSVDFNGDGEKGGDSHSGGKTEDNVDGWNK